MRLIDANRLDDVLEDFCFDYNGESDFNVGVRNGVLIARDIVQGTPTIEAELVRHGKWIYKDEAVFGNPYGHYNCSVCGNEIPHRTRYCCYCGAKMEQKE